ncbi:MAG: hypothetical protein CL930_05970 [Deltaproteobacteria bacterium]|nr:hypothetical protein [Deltaproteobacteria bacterium]
MFLPAPDESCWIGLLRLGLRVPGSRSLKDKRRAVSQIRDRLRARHNLSVSETGHLEDHGRAILCIALVANDRRFVQSVLDGIAHEVGQWRAALVENASVVTFRPGDESDESQYDEWTNG